VAGIFHTDELPAYGISQEEVEAVNKFLEIDKEDAFILVADMEEKSRKALLEVIRRAKTALEAVPEETRRALEDANTEYLRPLPTASRMYVETDIPAQTISRALLEDIRANLPELPSEKKARIMEQYGLSEDLANQLVRRDKVEQFEDIMVNSKVDATLVASTISYTLKEIERDGYLVDKLFANNQLEETFQLLIDEKVSKDAVPQVLMGVLRDNISAEDAAKKLNLMMISEEQVLDIIKKIVSTNGKLLHERGQGAMGSLMGMAMKELKAKADGQLVNKLLREEIQKYLHQNE